MKRFQGSCLCEEVQFEVTSDPMISAVCYCRDCQKAGGSDCSYGILVARDSFHLLQGKPSSFESTSATGNQVQRHFCSDCGSPLFATNTKNPHVISIRTGVLNHPEAFKPQGAIFTDSAQPWSQIPKGIPTWPKEYIPPQSS